VPIASAFRRPACTQDITDGIAVEHRLMTAVGVLAGASSVDQSVSAGAIEAKLT